MTAELQIVPIEGAKGFKLVGELDLTTTAQLEAALKTVGGDGATVTLDLADLAFLDSMGIRVLLSALKSWDGARTLVLLNPTGEVKRALEVAGLADGPPGIRVVTGAVDPA